MAQHRFGWFACPIQRTALQSYPLAACADPAASADFSDITLNCHPADSRGISDNEGTCTFSVMAPAWPSVGAKKLIVKGTLAVVLGGKEKVLEKKNVSFGEVSFDFGSIKKLPYSTGMEKHLEYLGKNPLRSIMLQDATGTNLVPLLSRQYVEIGDKREKLGKFSSAFSLVKKKATKKGAAGQDWTEPFTIRVVYFESVEIVKLPVHIEVGLDLQPTKQ